MILFWHTVSDSISFFKVSQQKFSIDAETGEVTVKKKRELEHGAYILAIRVNDQGSGQLSATASLTVCVEMDCCSSGCCSIVRDVNGKLNSFNFCSTTWTMSIVQGG